jgi:hypothetical protein
VSTTEPEQLEAVDVTDAAVPPAGEEIHLPGGSVLPLTVAIGITLTVIGTTIWWVWSLLGFIIFAVSTLLWVRDTRHEVDSLPEDHHHH